jgi:Ras-related protein Rab-6A
MKENSQSIRPSNFNNLSKSNMGTSKFDDTKFINSSLQETSQKQIYKFKIILLGDVSVGKTSLLTYFIDNKFNEEYKATISAELKTKILNVSQNVQASLNIWDTAGNERFKSITKQYFRDADGVILVYDIGRRESFNNIKFWMDEIENNTNKDIIIFLVGNKCDLVQKRNISFEEGEKLSKDLDVFFMEVSAKSGQNVFLLFEQITNYLCQNAENSRDFDYDDNNDNNINNKVIDNKINNRNKEAIKTLDEMIKKEKSKKDSCC